MMDDTRLILQGLGCQTIILSVVVILSVLFLSKC